MIPVDYRCQSCGAIRERLVARPIPSETVCDVCAGRARRRYSAFSQPGAARRKGREVLERERAESTRRQTMSDVHHHGPDEPR